MGVRERVGEMTDTTWQKKMFSLPRVIFCRSIIGRVGRKSALRAMFPSLFQQVLLRAPHPRCLEIVRYTF